MAIPRRNTPVTVIIYPRGAKSQAKSSTPALVNSDTNIPAAINSVQRKKLTSQIAVNKSIANGFTAEEHMTAVANIKSLYENAVLLLERGDLKNGDQSVTIRKFAAPIVFRGIIADALLTQKESLDKENGARIYSLELDEIVPAETSQSRVRPDSRSPSGNERPTHEDYLPEGIHKLQLKHQKIKEFLEKSGENSIGGCSSVIRRMRGHIWLPRGADRVAIPRWNTPATRIIYRRMAKNQSADAVWRSGGW